MTSSRVKRILLYGIPMVAFIASVQFALSADIEAVIVGQVNGTMNVSAALIPNPNTPNSLPVNSFTHQAGYPEGSSTIKVGTFQMVVPNTNITPILYYSLFNGEYLTITLRFYRHPTSSTTALAYTIVLTNAEIIDIRAWSPLGALPAGTVTTDPSQLTITLECEDIDWTWAEGGVNFDIP